jgi:protein SFI1
MRHFNPVRASSPAKSLSSSSATLSESRNTIAPELLHLSSEDVDILDAIIARAGHSATTFFTVFKAYSDVLGERGLHPQEVVYYGKLLKLGTLKGKNWGEKWKTVKAHLDSVSQLLVVHLDDSTYISILAIFHCTHMPSLQFCY